MNFLLPLSALQLTSPLPFLSFPLCQSFFFSPPWYSLFLYSSSGYHENKKKEEKDYSHVQISMQSHFSDVGRLVFFFFFPLLLFKFLHCWIKNDFFPKCNNNNSNNSNMLICPDILHKAQFCKHTHNHKSMSADAYGQAGTHSHLHCDFIKEFLWKEAGRLSGRTCCLAAQKPQWHGTSVWSPIHQT